MKYQRDEYLRIVSLGGFGQVTQNMFVYETPNDILVVDCGVGFPEEEMMGVDLVIPDISYLKERADKIRGVVLSHGHDDHIGGLPYILPQLPANTPVFGPKWAIALSKLKLKDFGIIANLKEVNETSKISLGGFLIEFIEVTHSIPNTYHLVIRTPVGVFYHAADFKLDLTPVMGQPTRQERIAEIGSKGVICLLSDCLRAENPGFTPPEAKLEEMFEKEIADCRGKFFVTTISSNISRLKQAIDVSLRHDRKVVLVGRSIEKNMLLAEKLKYLKFSQDTFVKKKDIRNHPPNRLTLLVAGSQAQAGSALDRITAGEVDDITIQPGDKVIFSTDYIPGNEIAIYHLIDNIYRLGGDVVYQDIRDNVHVSGHGSKKDLGKLVDLVKPRWFIPIGGNFRHMVAYRKLVEEKEYRSDQVILADGGQFVEFFPEGKMLVSKGIETRRVMVDALGVGDVGKVVLRDRQILAQEGMVVVVLPIDQNSHTLDGDPEIITRGFIYIRDNLEFIKKTKAKIRRIMGGMPGRRLDFRFIRKEIQGELEEFFFKHTGRRPMVLPVIIEV